MLLINNTKKTVNYAFTVFAGYESVWLENYRNFTAFLSFKARPVINVAVFMQCLYGFVIGRTAADFGDLH